MLLLHASCERENKVPVNDFGGYYKLYSIIAEQEVDINNDGIQSNNIFHEYASTIPKDFAFYNPNWFSNFAEIRPTIFQTGDGQLADFRFPCQEISYERNNEGKPELVGYLSRFMNYSYEIDKNGNILLSNNNHEFGKQFGEIHSLKRNGTVTFDLDMTLNLFDFKAEKWISTKAIASYQRVSDEEVKAIFNEK